MKRRDFFRKLVGGAALLSAAPHLALQPKTQLDTLIEFMRASLELSKRRALCVNRACIDIYTDRVTADYFRKAFIARYRKYAVEQGLTGE